LIPPPERTWTKSMELENALDLALDSALEDLEASLTAEISLPEMIRAVAVTGIEQPEETRNQASIESTQSELGKKLGYAASIAITGVGMAVGVCATGRLALAGSALVSAGIAGGTYTYRKEASEIGAGEFIYEAGKAGVTGAATSCCTSWLEGVVRYPKLTFGVGRIAYSGLQEVGADICDRKWPSFKKAGREALKEAARAGIESIGGTAQAAINCHSVVNVLAKGAVNGASAAGSQMATNFVDGKRLFDDGLLETVVIGGINGAIQSGTEEGKLEFGLNFDRFSQYVGPESLAVCGSGVFKPASADRKRF